MQDSNSNYEQEQNLQSPTARDLVAILFRHRRLMALSFFGILIGTILVVALEPNRYDAEMKILVKRGRLDPVVTPDATALPPFDPVVSEEELNSETELFKSRDLLEKVVRACNLQNADDSIFNVFAKHFPGYSAKRPDDPIAISKAVNKLAKTLNVEVVKKTYLLEISYESKNPKLAAQVLNSVSSYYLEKHVDVHRPFGAFDFFQQATDRYRRELADAEGRLTDFEQSASVVSAQSEGADALQKYAQFEADLKQTQASIAQSEQRIETLQKQETTIPERITTQIRQSDDAMLLSQLQSNLLNLELKRTELLQKFEPSYRPVQELESQIDQSRKAIAAAEKVPLRDETTDRDPAHEWAREELAKEKADLAGLQARAAATAVAARAYQDKAKELGQSEITQDDLIRTVKMIEDNYLLYERKEEETRISDALDRGRILNVVIAEPPTVPALPSNKRGLTLTIGVLLAGIISFGLVFGSEYMDQTFRTPSEVANVLNLPVLAAIPTSTKHKNSDVANHSMGLDKGRANVR